MVRVCIGCRPSSKGWFGRALIHWPTTGAGAQQGGAALNVSYSHKWQDSAPTYQRMFAELRAAAKRLRVIQLHPEFHRCLTEEQLDKLRFLEPQITCLALQPLFFTEMFHGVTLLPDGGFRALDSWSEVHFREAGLLSPGDRAAIAQVYGRLSQNRDTPLRVVEIGSAIGRGSTRIAGEFVKRSGGVLYCIDPWVPAGCDQASRAAQMYYYAFVANVQMYGLEKTIVPIRSPSVEAAILFENDSLDCVFVDGNHEYPHVLADVDAYLPKVRKGGLIFGHDLTDLPSKFDRDELLGMAHLNNGLANYRNSQGHIEKVDVHPGVVLAVQDRFGDDVEHIPDSVVWVKQL